MDHIKEIYFGDEFPDLKGKEYEVIANMGQFLSMENRNYRFDKLLKNTYNNCIFARYELEGQPHLYIKLQDGIK